MGKVDWIELQFIFPFPLGTWHRIQPRCQVPTFELPRSQPNLIRKPHQSNSTSRKSNNQRLRRKQPRLASIPNNPHHSHRPAQNAATPRPDLRVRIKSLPSMDLFSLAVDGPVFRERE